MNSSNKSTLFVMALAVAACLYGNASLRLSSLSEFPIRYQTSGVRLLQEKNVLEPCSLEAIASWSFPTSIVVNNISYVVNGRENFRISMMVSPFDCVADGMVCRMPNARDARIAGFGVLGMNNVGLDAFMAQVSVSILDPSTNAVFATDHNHSVLVYNNLFINIRGTNTYDFARALLNAGLPDASPKLRSELQGTHL